MSPERRGAHRLDVSEPQTMTLKPCYTTPPVDAVPLRIAILQVDILAVDSDQSCTPSC
jgi:hypothetical protein